MEKDLDFKCYALELKLRGMRLEEGLQVELMELFVMRAPLTRNGLSELSMRPTDER